MRLSSKGKRQKKDSKKSKDPVFPIQVTPWIGKLAGGLFVRTLLICRGENALRDREGLEATAEAEDMTMEALIDITTDPEAVRRAGWSGREETVLINFVGHPIWKDDSTGRIGYSSAVVDGIIIRPGDFVTVRYAFMSPVFRVLS
jgi:hypothetical protein